MASMGLRRARAGRRAIWWRGYRGTIACPFIVAVLALWPAALTTGATARAALEPHQAPGPATGARLAVGAAASRELPLLGNLALPGFNADIWAHNGFAYIGTWGTAKDYPAKCPATGVRIVDLADPRRPAPAGAVAAIRGTSQEDVEVLRVATAAFTGDLLVTGVQACAQATDAPRGLDLWDVSDPRSPRHLALWESGPAAAGSARGVHELHLFQRGDRAYVAAAVPYSEVTQGTGDFRLVDVTDPRRPVQVSSWGAAADGGLRPGPGQAFYAHSARVDRAGTRVAVSYWDAGALLLDISDPARPVLVGRTPYPAGSDGDSHSAAFAQGETTLLTTDEELRLRGDSWGYLRLWDVRDPAAPAEIGRFATASALDTSRDGPGVYSVHNPFVRGNTAYLSWFGDGVRVLDITDPRAPSEIAHYVPPATADPYGEEPTAPHVWGVYATGDLILLSDINAGLYVLPAPRAAPQCFPETGHCLGERFYDAWHATGGLASNGYPLTAELTETLEDGRQYTVQYFERTRLEYHPENRPPYDILLGQFGRRIHPADPAAAPLEGATYVFATGHNLGGRFRDYWLANGGLERFGLPISEEFTERLEDGKEYRVQYFERARFEHHPENSAPYDVLLGQFGRRILAER